MSKSKRKKIFPELPFYWMIKEKKQDIIGRPQNAILQLIKDESIKGSVLNLGCGTADDALTLSMNNIEVTCIDLSEDSIKIALEKANEYYLGGTFIVGDFFDLNRNEKKFDTVIDTGLFHTLNKGDRLWYVLNLMEILRPGGTYYLLCFNDLEPGISGPKRISRMDIYNLFKEGWEIKSINETSFENKMGNAKAWLVTILRID